MLEDYDKQDSLSFYANSKLKNIFIDRELEKIELNKLNELYNRINDFCNKTIGINNYLKIDSINYLDNYGYYSYFTCDNGLVNIVSLGNDIDEVFNKIIIDILFSYTFIYEKKYRSNLIKDYISRFKNIKYMSALYYAEIALNYLNIYFKGNISNELVKYYKNYLDNTVYSERNNLSWYYNKQYKKFSCIKVRNLK